MRRPLVLLVAIFSLACAGSYGSPATKASSRVLSLCELVDNWKDYNRQTVQVRAIFVSGAEQAWLYDPSCRKGEGLTDVSFRQHTKGVMKKLDQLLAKDRRAWVTFEGVFYGPEPFEKIDPKLPVSIRERLEKSHKRYGHMDSFETKIDVTRAIEASKVETNVPQPPVQREAEHAEPTKKP